MTQLRKTQRTKIQRIDGEKFPIGVGHVAVIYRSTRSGKIWQYRHWVKSEQKYFRISLHTTNLRDAQHRAEEQFLKLSGQIYSGHTVFSITAGEQVLKSLSFQSSRKKTGVISLNRLLAFKRVMSRYLDFVGSDTRLSNLPMDRFRKYLEFRRAHTPPPSFLTIQQEQSDIMGLFKWSIDEKLLPATAIPKFSQFKTLPGEGKRAGISFATYNQIVSFSKGWHKHTTNDRDTYDRRILHHAIMGMAWYGWRTGEMLALEWRDVQIRDDDTAVVTLRPEVTKTRVGRLNINRADIFRRVKEFSKHTGPTNRVFASFANNANLMSEGTYFYQRWAELKTHIRAQHPDFNMGADPYCFRHLWITIRLLAGDSPYDIARLAGNSLRMIEQHYDHVRNELIAQKILRKRVRFNPDGTLTVTEVIKEGAPQ